VAIVVNDCKLLISRSLETAIRELKRRGAGYDSFWIDAICINQGDKDERGHQIPKMRDIYHNAYETIVWLGEENEHTKEALSLFACLATGEPENMFRMRTMQLMSIGHDTSLRDLPRWWLSADALLALPYWERTLVIQEMAMSRYIVLLWGSHTVDFRTIWLVVEILNKYNTTPQTLRTIGHIEGIFRVITGLTDDGKDKRKVPTADRDLLTVLSDSCRSRASEPRDKIFGVLALAVSKILTPSLRSFDE
jgi:hypothetical protein